MLYISLKITVYYTILVMRIMDIQYNYITFITQNLKHMLTTLRLQFGYTKCH